MFDATGCGYENLLNELVTGGYLSSLPNDPKRVIGSFCYHYTASPNSSTWTCDGVPRTNYRYSILFSLEVTDPTEIKKVTSQNGGAAFSHCVVGPLK